ncbi:hypothetical protein HMPREF0326_01210 [Desulfovibrio sp. 3_1_syn3]|uniref:ABC transporter substrate-binding protein n=1 Tax=Desulfovibrio sp. 3_1_syn3 TaxID=457398 RepID=UPI0001E12534|nr:ABC transporter substrate-binding protein [Desulfovibrio sp. 3_1_syn3]EFL87434.1 hypothetical protein HMPREF0326_01210 [Desulfovibrio sp. 3_1_syn3]
MEDFFCPASSPDAPDSSPPGNSGSRPCCIFVHEDGAVETAYGKDELISHCNKPELVSLAVALLRSEHPQLRFSYIKSRKFWLAIRMRPERTRFPGARVVMQFRRIDPPWGLSLRELDVLTLLSAGLSNPDIAHELFLSPRTVAKHVENIFIKLAVKNRVHAVRLALDHGLVRYPTPGSGHGGCSTLRSLERTMGQTQLSSPRVKLWKPPPLLIGLPLPLNGPGSADAAEMINGATLALREINARGGVNGRELRILTANYNVLSPESVKAACEQFIHNEVDAISAGYTSAETAVHNMIGAYGAPYLHSATMESVVNNVRHSPTRLGNIFQVCASDVKYGPGLARFILSLEDSGTWRPPCKKVAVVMTQWPDLDIGLPEAEKILSPRHWNIEIISPPHDRARDWKAVCDFLQRLGPGVIVLASYLVEDGIAFQAAFSGNPIPALVYMLYNPSVPNFCMELGKRAEGVLWATTSGIYRDSIGMRFRRMYREAFGETAGQSHAGLAYDRIHILANAWARVGNPRQFRNVVRDLRTMVHRGVNGAYFFGGEGQVGLAFPDDTMDPSISKAHLVFQVQDGVHRILCPAPYRNGSFRLPAWYRDA